MRFSWCKRKTIGFSVLAFCLALIGPATLLTSNRGVGSDEQEPKAEKPQPSGPRLETIAVRSENLVRSIEIPASVEGDETADLYAKIGGFLAEISVDLGDTVHEGQELARIDVPEMVRQLDQKQALLARAEVGVEQAQAAVEQAQAEIVRSQAEVQEAKTQKSEKRALREFRQAGYNRLKKLVQSGSLAEERLDEAAFELDSAQAALGSAEAKIHTAEAAFSAAEANRYRAETDLKMARAEIDVAHAAGEQVRAMLAYATIRAPFDGVVTQRWVDRGAFIQPAQGNSAAGPLLRVTRIDVVRIVFDLPMREVRALDRNDRAVLDRINVLPGESFPGRVSRFSPSLDPTTRMMRVEVDLENPHGRLLPGYYGYLKLLLEELPQTPVIPSSALITRREETFVFEVQNGVCRKRPVGVNYQDGTIVGIASGLVGGEQVVRAGGGQLVDGQAVIAVPTPLPMP